MKKKHGKGSKCKRQLMLELVFMNELESETLVDRLQGSGEAFW